jgi:hypothetical protein
MDKENREFQRFARLMYLGKVPRYVRCYDNGGVMSKFKNKKTGEILEGSVDRYTVVFTGRYTHKTGGSFWYLGMDESPYSPGGFGQHGEFKYPCDRPTSSHLGKRIDFSKLPADCQKLVIDDYSYLWDIRKFLGLPEKD